MCYSQKKSNRSNTSHIFIALMAIILISFLSCSTFFKTKAGSDDKSKAESERIYEMIKVGDTLTFGLMEKVDKYGFVVGKNTKSIGVIVIYNYKDTLRQIGITNDRVVLFKDLEDK
jgi:hypothetical protein